MIFKNNLLRIALRQILPIGILLAGVSSCSVSHSMAGETDGVYFDPNTDQVPVYASTTVEEDYYYPDGDETLVRIGGKYFDENGNAPTLEKQQNYTKSNRYSKYYPEWGNESKDVKVSVNYFGSPFYNSFGFGLGYGFSNWDYPYYGWGNNPYAFNSGIYWNSPYYGYSPFYSRWNPYYNPYYSPYYYNPYYGSYNPYYYGGYSPYYGSYYPGYYRNVRPIKRGKGMDSNVTVSENSNYRSRDYRNTRVRPQSERRYRNYSNERPTRVQRENSNYNSYRNESYRNSNSWNNSNNSWRSSSAPSTRSYSPTTGGGNRNGRVVFE